MLLILRIILVLLIVRAGVAGRQDQDRGQPGHDHDGRASPVACHVPTSGCRFCRPYQSYQQNRSHAVSAR